MNFEYKEIKTKDIIVDYDYIYSFFTNEESLYFSKLPLIVLEKNNKFILFDGYKRYRYLEKENIDIVNVLASKDVNEEEMFFYALDINLNSRLEWNLLEIYLLIKILLNKSKNFNEIENYFKMTKININKDLIGIFSGLIINSENFSIFSKLNLKILKLLTKFNQQEINLILKFLNDKNINNNTIYDLLELIFEIMNKNDFSLEYLLSLYNSEKGINNFKEELIKIRYKEIYLFKEKIKKEFNKLRGVYQNNCLNIDLKDNYEDDFLYVTMKINKTNLNEMKENINKLFNDKNLEIFLKKYE